MRKAMTMLLVLLWLGLTAVVAVGRTSNWPDLIISALKAQDEQLVLYTVVCQDCPKPIAAGTISVRIVIFGKDGVVKWTHSDVVPLEIAATKPTDLTLNLPSNMNLLDTTFTLEIDSTGKISESNELNNVSQKVEGFSKKPSATVAEPLDLLLREALYFTGDVEWKVDTQTKYVTKNKPATVKRSQAVICVNDLCKFNFGIIGMRTAGLDVLMQPRVKLTLIQDGKPVWETSHHFSFNPQKATASVVLTLEKLRIGENKIKVEIDVYKEFQEANEDNNSFEVTVILEP